MKCEYTAEDLKCDTVGRAIVFDKGNLTFGNSGIVSYQDAGMARYQSFWYGHPTLVGGGG